MLVYFVELFVATLNINAENDSVTLSGFRGRECDILCLPWSQRKSSHIYIDDPSLITALIPTAM